MSWLWAHPVVLVMFLLGACSCLVTLALFVLAMAIAARDRRERVLRALRAEHYARCDAFALDGRVIHLPPRGVARDRRGFGA